MAAVGEAKKEKVYAVERYGSCTPLSYFVLTCALSRTCAGALRLVCCSAVDLFEKSLCSHIPAVPKTRAVLMHSPLAMRSRMHSRSLSLPFTRSPGLFLCSPQDP